MLRAARTGCGLAFLLGSLWKDEILPGSIEQMAIATALESIAPAADLRLVGFAMIAEWQQPDGQRLLTRLIGDGGNPWQAKGYFYDGLSKNWPMAEEETVHHNPGHPPCWRRLD